MGRQIGRGTQASKVRVRQAFVRGEFKSPKSRRGARGVPLAAELHAALDGLRDVSSFAADDGLVFAHPATGKPLARSFVYTRFKRACRRAGVRIVRFHDLRHTFGTRIAASGEVSPRTLQEWMGHRDAKTTLIYADYQPAEHESEIASRASIEPLKRVRAETLPIRVARGPDRLRWRSRCSSWRARR